MIREVIRLHRENIKINILLILVFLVFSYVFTKIYKAFDLWLCVLYFFSFYGINSNEKLNKFLYTLPVNRRNLIFSRLIYFYTNLLIYLLIYYLVNKTQASSVETWKFILVITGGLYYFYVSIRYPEKDILDLTYIILVPYIAVGFLLNEINSKSLNLIVLVILIFIAGILIKKLEGYYPLNKV